MDPLTERKFNFTYLFYAAVVVAFAYVLYRNEQQLWDIAAVLSEGTWYLVGASIGLVLLVLLNQAALYASLYQIFHLPTLNMRMLTLYLMTRFVAVAAPAGGLSAVAPFIHDARKRDLAMGRVIIANLLYVVLWYSSFAIFLIVGLAQLYFAQDLLWEEVVAATILFVINTLLITMLILGATNPQRLEIILRGLARRITTVMTGLRRKTFFSEQQATLFVHDLQEALKQMSKVGWRRLWRPAAHGIINEVLIILVLLLVASAFGVTLTYGELVATYSVSMLFLIISPTPGGLGFVEGLLVLTLTSFGVASDKALVITLGYRGVTFWLPFFLGFVVAMGRRIGRINTG